MFDDLLAARSIKFLTNFAPYVEDLQTIFLMLEHTPLIAAFTSNDYLEGTTRSVEEWEWKAQVYFAKGNLTKAKDMLEFALLPSGELSIKGSLISADINEKVAEEIIRKARKLYPESKTLSYIWMSQYAPSKVPAGLVM